MKITWIDMNFLQIFFLGASYLGKGCRAFYRDWRAWKYSLLPLLVVCLLYGFLFWGTLSACQYMAMRMEPWMTDLPGWLMWLGNCITGVLYFSGVLLVLLIAAVTLGTFYELFGGVFFDLLVEYFEKKEYGNDPKPFQLRFALLSIWDTIRWALRSVIFFLLCLPLSFLIPFAGQGILILVMGYHYGVSGLLSPHFYHGMRLKELQKNLKGKRIALWGFGTISYLLLTIPFAAVFLLPGMILGGAMLYHEQIFSSENEYAKQINVKKEV